MSGAMVRAWALMRTACTKEAICASPVSSSASDHVSVSPFAPVSVVAAFALPKFCTFASGPRSPMVRSVVGPLPLHDKRPSSLVTTAAPSMFTSSCAAGSRVRPSCGARTGTSKRTVA